MYGYLFHVVLYITEAAPETPDVPTDKIVRGRDLLKQLMPR
jgi:hypothetical protein